MSLLKDDILVELYNEAAKPRAHEHHSKTFWTHLLSREFIKDRSIVLATEVPPTPNPEDALRRVDFALSTLNPRRRLQVVAIGEIKRATGSTDDVEAQLQQACQSCAMYNKEDVWGIAMKGTKAKVFQHTWKGNRFYHISHENYIDAHSNDARILADAFTTIIDAISQPVQSVQPVASSSTPADGWYPAGDGTNRQRYYRNGQWTSDYHP